MAIDTNAQAGVIIPRNYRNAQADRDTETLQTILRGSQGMLSQAQQAAQQKDLMQAKAAQDLDTLSKAKDLAGPDAGVKAGEVSFTPDPTAKRSGADFQKLQGAYDKIDKSYSPVFDRLQTAQRGLQAGDSLGMKQAIVGLAGVTEGASQRLLGSVIQQFGGDPTIAGSEDKVSNFLDGLQRSGKSAAFQASMTHALEGAYSQAKGNFMGKLSELKSAAPVTYPGAAANPGFGAALDNLGASTKARFGSMDADFQDLQKRNSAPVLPGQGNEPGPGTKIMDAGKNLMSQIGGGLSSLLSGSNRNPASAPAPAAPQGPAPAALQGPSPQATGNPQAPGAPNQGAMDPFAAAAAEIQRRQKQAAGSP